MLWVDLMGVHVIAKIANLFNVGVASFVLGVCIIFYG